MEQSIRDFQEIVWSYYASSGRHDLPWRQPTPKGEFDPYAIMVSEIMLQQTQVARVIPKYAQFLTLFPDIETLAKAELGAVLRAWQGLGYNRRAKYLWQAAGMVASEYTGIFPRTQDMLLTLPGVGENTAGAICAYAFDQRAVFIETNIRTVYIHHFFLGQSDIADRMIREKVRETLPEDESPREWYWALMDYGTHLKQVQGNLNKLSRSYAKQSTFHGSRRQLRGAILRMLSENPAHESDLIRAFDDERLQAVLRDLTSEQLIRQSGDTYTL